MFTWTVENQKRLMDSVKVGMGVGIIAKEWGVRSEMLYRELRRGLSKEEIDFRQWMNYRPGRVYKNEFVKKYGEEALEELLDEVRREKRSNE